MWIYVKTNKRQYHVRGGSRVVWERGEKVIEMYVVS